MLAVLMGSCSDMGLRYSLEGLPSVCVTCVRCQIPSAAVSSATTSTNTTACNCCLPGNRNPITRKMQGDGVPCPNSSQSTAQRSYLFHPATVTTLTTVIILLNHHCNPQEMELRVDMEHAPSIKQWGLDRLKQLQRVSLELVRKRME